GISAIYKRLVGLQAEFEKITRVVLVIDADDNPVAAFNEGCVAFARANIENPAKQYPVPTTVDLITTTGSPATAVVLIPGSDQPGCLDTLLLPSFEERYAADSVRCVSEFCECVNGAERGETRHSKLRLRALIAASQHRNPGVSLSYLLEEKNCPVELAHASFDPLRALLNGLFP
ncbi:MAG: DUF3226 domain-containing protein, partial [Candidatus Acidiferrales bacterium]